MKRAKFLFLYLTVGSICIFLNCKEGWGGSKKLSVLKSPGDGEIPEYTLTPLLVIGEDDDPRAMLYRPNGICVDLDGNIFVLDGGNKRVVKFTKDGRYLKEFGRMGQGPLGSFAARSV